VWSLGVILYMLVTGRAPFQEANDSETLTMILDCRYYLPSSLSTDCVDLISRMLVREPEKRLPLDEICRHRWFKDLAEETASSDEFSDILTSSDESLNSLSINEFPNLQNPAASEVSTGRRRSKTKSREKLLKMVTLIKRENLSEKQNAEIIDCMVAGHVSSRDEIMKALDEDLYNHITGTYYLLAERLIRKRLQRKIKRKQAATSHREQQQQREALVVPVAQKKAEGNGAGLLHNQYKRKLNAQARNKLIRQVVEAEEEEEEAAAAAVAVESEAVAEANAFLGNIIEDEEETPAAKSQELFVLSQPAQARRSSRGADTAISALTILEEVESDLGSPGKGSGGGVVYVVKQAGEEAAGERSDKLMQQYSSSADKLDVRVDLNLGVKGKKYNSETSCSDNSDNELKVHGKWIWAWEWKAGLIE